MTTHTEESTKYDLIEQLRGYMTDVFPAESRHLQVLERRFGIHRRTYTLQEIGDSLGVTREAIRLIEKKAIQKFSKALLVTTEFRCRPEVDIENLRLNLKKFRETLDSIGEVVMAVEVDEALTEGFSNGTNAPDKGLVALLLTLFGYREMEGDNNLDACWIRREVRDVKRFNDFAVRINNTLFKGASGITLFDLRGKMNKSLGRTMDDDEIRLAIKICRNVEEINLNGEPLFRIRFHSLPSLSEKAYRVFEESGDQTPIPFKSILREINHRRSRVDKPVNARSLQQQLVNDKRFKSIGNSGEWILSKWKDIETGTILQVMTDVFHSLNRTLSVEEITSNVMARRPQTAPNSVKMYLDFKDTFVRVGARTYELSAWGSKPFLASPRRKTVRKKATKREQMHGIIREYLSSQPEKTALLEAVWLDLKGRIDCPRASFYSVLSGFDEVEKISGDGKSKLCRLISRGGLSGEQNSLPAKVNKILEDMK